MVSQKIRNLKCMYHARSHVLCPSNKEIHDCQRMPFSVLQYTHIRCFLSPLPDVALFHCQQ